MRNLLSRNRSARLGMMASAALIAVATSTLSAGAAQASPPPPEPTCPGSPVHGVNGNGPAAQGEMKIDAHLKVTPYAGCANVALAKKGTLLYYHCWVENSYGNLWVWARMAGTSTEGWMSGDNLPPVKVGTRTYC